jgi:hypothetical protein
VARLRTRTDGAVAEFPEPLHPSRGAIRLRFVQRVNEANYYWLDGKAFRRPRFPAFKFPTQTARGST